jgi:hypothetical protein
VNTFDTRTLLDLSSKNQRYHQLGKSESCGECLYRGRKAAALDKFYSIDQNYANFLFQIEFKLLLYI